MFSPLTPEEKGEPTSFVHTRLCRTIFKVALVCLALLIIAGGILILILLPQVVACVGISQLVLGGVLLVLVLVLCVLDSRLKKKNLAVAEDILIEDLQGRLKQLIEATQVRELVRRGFVDEVNVEATILNKERQLAEFDRELRRKAYALYTLIVAEDNRGEKFVQLVELREMQCKIAEQLELLYRAYLEFLSGTMDSVNLAYHEGQIVDLQNKIAFVSQELSDIQAMRKKKLEKIKAVLQYLKQISSQAKELESKLQLQKLQSPEDNKANREEIAKLADLQYKKMCYLTSKWEALTLIDGQIETKYAELKQLKETLALMCDAEMEFCTFYSEYKVRYLYHRQRLGELFQKLEFKDIELKQLRDLLRESQNKFKKIMRTVENQDKFFKKLGDEFKHEMAEKIEIISALEEQLFLKNQELSEAMKQVYPTEKHLKNFLELQRNYEHLKEEKQHLQDMCGKDILKLTKELTISKRQAEEFEKKAAELHELLLSYESDQAIEELTGKKLRNALDELTRTKLLLANLESNSAEIESLLQEVQIANRELRIEFRELSIKNSLTEESLQLTEEALATAQEQIEVFKKSKHQWSEAQRNLVHMNMQIQYWEDKSSTLELEVSLLQKELATAQEAITRSEQEKYAALIDYNNLMNQFQVAEQMWGREKQQLEEKLTDRYINYEIEKTKLSHEKQRLEQLLQDARTHAAQDASGALPCLARQVIQFSPHIKSGSKPVILKYTDEEVLAYTAPRFFGILGSRISSERLCPEISLSSQVSLENQEKAVTSLCFKEWLFALLGFMSLQNLSTLVNSAADEVKNIETSEGSVGWAKLYRQLREKYPQLADAEVLLRAWLTTCHFPVTRWPIYRDLEQWQQFLIMSLLQMHDREGGKFFELDPKEQAFLEVMSCFSGKLPLVLSSIRASESWGPIFHHPLVPMDYEHCRNMNWEDLVKIVEILLQSRPSLSILTMEEIRKYFAKKS
ncbi:DNA double-strand break repair Rad50 ATPase [Candidatus Chlamydia sanziniae]|uniref:DNA double-strand break repair Rad50 ATPase n=2 Tax=Candidatus Chlamydia sanziniae TaxID=1806891 RepID=A0A1A9HU61_9CHLA|nr:DNA double-strand break repair Rad50 ATPase [Candidatus Chlamydia sanziniae]